MPSFKISLKNLKTQIRKMFTFETYDLTAAVAHEICIAVVGGLSAQPLDIVEVFDSE